MERAHVREEVDAPIDMVWKVIRDFADVSAWASGRVVHIEGAGVGMVELITIGPKRCAIDWSADFEPLDPASATALRTAIENVFRKSFIAKLRDRLTRS